MEWPSWAKGIVSVMCFSLLFGFCWAQAQSELSEDAQPHQEEHQELRILSSNIRDRLLSLKQESLSMKEQLEMLSASLESSQGAQAILAEQLTKSSASLTSINEELTSCYDSIAKLESKVKSRGRIVLALGIVFGAMILAKIAGYILYACGIKVPRWLDILL